MQFIIKSAQLLGNRNTAILAYDLYTLRYISDDSFSIYDNNVIDDILNYFQKYLRIGEKAKALNPIGGDENIKLIIGRYGQEFSRALNSVYDNKGKKFRLSDVVTLDGTSLIATVFRYDNKDKEPLFHKDFTKLNIDGLTNNEISAHLSVKRIIKLYPQKDTIVFIKPNQYRYWLSLAAYRDADKCFSDLSKLKS